jgi:ribosomal protein S18 acetylase RimI-like enzyme
MNSCRPSQTKRLHIYSKDKYQSERRTGFRLGLAILGEEIVGVTMTHEEWVSDLWVRKDVRRIGVGGRLLAEAEREIRSRGHETFRLRVVKSNIRAVHFYETQGWRVRREFPHEKFGHAMFEMTKSDRKI